MSVHSSTLSSSSSDDSDNEEARAAEAGLSIVVRNPKKEDVLFGRGPKIAKHPGNVKFREIIKKYVEQYAGRNKKKNQIAVDVLEQVHSRHGRFLQRLKVINHNGKLEENWSPITDEHFVLEKIKQNFRDKIRDTTESKRKAELDTWCEDEQPPVEYQTFQTQGAASLDQHPSFSFMVQKLNDPHDLPDLKRRIGDLSHDEAPQQKRAAAAAAAYPSPQDSQGKRRDGHHSGSGSFLVDPGRAAMEQARNNLEQQETLHYASLRHADLPSQQQNGSNIIPVLSSRVASSLDPGLALAMTTKGINSETLQNIATNGQALDYYAPQDNPANINNNDGDVFSRSPRISLLQETLVPGMNQNMIEQQNLMFHLNQYDELEGATRSQVLPSVLVPSCILNGTSTYSPQPITPNLTDLWLLSSQVHSLSPQLQLLRQQLLGNNALHSAVTNSITANNNNMAMLRRLLLEQSRNSTYTQEEP